MDMKDFESLLTDYLANKRKDMKNKFNRVLPTGELLFNRFDKADYLNAGNGSSVYDTSVIMGDIVIGKNVWVGPYALLEGLNAQLKIGDNVSIDTGVTIYTHDSTKYMVSGGVNAFEKGPVTIGNNTVICTKATILCNVTVGHHCVIGAHSLVNKSIPDYSIAAGTPVKIIGKVLQKNNGEVELVYF